MRKMRLRRSKRSKPGVSIRRRTSLRRDGRRSAFVAATAAVVLIGGLALFPTPFYLLSPGTAVDLSRSVAVEGHVPTRRRFYLTDVTVTHASLLLLLAGFVPGTRIVKHELLVPAGQTMQSYDRVLSAAMDDSQHVAAYVAERAAGLPLGAPSSRVEILDFTPASRAGRILQVGDRLAFVAGRKIRHTGDVSQALEPLPAGTRVLVKIERDGRETTFQVPTIRTPAGTRFGIAVGERTITPELPVPVHFSLANVEGPSGGLMFALAIYAELTGDRRALPPVAGTGTISADGTVGPIEGTQQKIIAAERAGASTFLVPLQNYKDVRNERGITVVPVATFAQALAATRS
jgi:PDZ domain-containing protein